MKIKYLNYILIVLSVFSDLAFAQIKTETDQWVEGRIQGVLDFNKYNDSSDIDVTYANGLLSLKGVVNSEIDKNFAEKIARKISGSAKIVNYIKVNKNLTPRSRTDLEQYIADFSICAKVNSMLQALKISNESFIEAQSDRGIVYLTGRAATEEVSSYVERIASNVTGVKFVKNQIRIEDPLVINEKIDVLGIKSSLVPEDVWISSQVRLFLNNNIELAGNDVYLVTKQGVVELKGFVRDNRQRNNLSDYIMAIKGVKEITDHTSVR